MVYVKVVTSEITQQTSKNLVLKWILTKIYDLPIFISYLVISTKTPYDSCFFVKKTTISH